MKLILQFVTFFICSGFVHLDAKPNVLLFLVDDLGSSDLGCFGSDFYETPNIDQLASSGIKFTQGYAACTVCSPTRAAFVTGQHPARLHITDYIPGGPIVNPPMNMPDWTKWLALKEVTLAEILKANGYATAHVGKWHLSHWQPRHPNGEKNDPKHYPTAQGYDQNIGGAGRGLPDSYFWPYGRGNTLEARKNNPIYQNLPEGGKEGEYLTDRLAAESVKWLESVGENPFFLSLCFYNVHTPIQGRPDLVKKYQKKLKDHPGSRHNNPVYAAMVENVDEAVGTVLETLKKQGKLENTFVLFTSDNGGLTDVTDNLGIRQGKGGIYEGGIRVPWIIRWPGVTPENSVSEQLVTTMDIFPTVLDVTGLPTPPELAEKLDGISLVSHLKNPQNKICRNTLYWHYPHYHMLGAQPYSAIRDGDWKLIEHHKGKQLELYHLANDLHEDHNLASKHPDKAEALLAKLQAWRKKVGAQMPTLNKDYQPDQPTGWPGKIVRKPAPIRQ
jgi:arylsulfatase A